MEIRVWTLTSALHDRRRIEEESARFLAQIQEHTAVRLAVAGDGMDGYDAAGGVTDCANVIYVRTGGVEMQFAGKVQVRQGRPVYLLTSGGNNSLAASMEILSYVRDHCGSGEILHGSAEYIGRRLTEIAQVEHARSQLEGSVIGVIGQPSDWLIASRADETALRNMLGISVKHIEMKELLEEALEVYDRFFWNEEDGLACDFWNTEFTVMDDYRGLNANMHSVEAFLAAADVMDNQKYRTRCKRIIDSVIGWAREEHWRIPEHYSKDWVPLPELHHDRPADPFKPYGATPGHGMEWSRLITQWALSTYGDANAPDSGYIEASEQLFLRAVEDAWNVDGAPGFVYTTDWEGRPVVHDRMHWVLAEAINTAAILYRITKKTEYADYYAEFMKYLDEKVVDHVRGSWYHQMDEKNHVTGTVWPGKNDLYHAFQATLIPCYKAGLSLSCAVHEHLCQ